HRQVDRPVRDIRGRRACQRDVSWRAQDDSRPHPGAGAGADPAIAVDPGLLESAIAGARQVLQQMGPAEARYLTLVELLEVAGRPDEIPAVFAEAVRQLTNVSASF